MDLTTIKEHRLKSIFQFSIPAIIAMVLTSLITVVDGFFIGNYVGAQGLAAVNLGLPIVYLYLGVGLMVSVGGIAIAGMALGEQNIQQCNRVFNQTMLTTIGASVVLSLIVWACLDPMLGVLKATGQTALYFKQYYMVMLLQLPVMIINASFGMFIRGEGKPQYFMQVNVLNLLINIVLDYVFVKWLNLGVTGIAVASLIAGVVTMLCILRFFQSKSTVFKLGKFHFSKEVLKNTILNGFSELIGELSLCISMFAYNFVIMRHIGVNGVTAFAIVGYLSYIFSMIVIGFGQGTVSLFSFTYGAQEYTLTAAIRKTTTNIVFFVGVAVFLLVAAFSGAYSSLFVKDAVVQQMVGTGTVLFSLSFLFCGINTITSFYFTSIGKAVESAVISSARGLVFLLVCIFTLPALLGMTGVWLAAPITEVGTLFISLFFLGRKQSHFPSSPAPAHLAKNP